MAHGHHADPSQPSYSGGTTAYAPSSPAETARTSGPCHCDEAAVPSTCCDTECFERPRYFCGHLLTDADLSLEQRYVIGKHKLYHRALHGHGIVCGLRLTCDPACGGNVIVGEGFAIDDCGNDLVACEPAPFDVVAALRDKKLLYSAPPRDDCEPEKSASDCPIRDCFYVVACYDEEAQEYATPLTAACGPSPRECEPTRVRETVRFDVLDKLPKTVDPLADLECRIQQCFLLVMEGPFAEALKDPLTQEALSGSAKPEQHEGYDNQIRKLRILFKRYLECHPDHYNCALGKDIDAIACPPAPKGTHGYGQPDPASPLPSQIPGQARQVPPGYPAPGQPQNPTPGGSSQTYGTDVRGAVCRLVDLAYSHVMACVMGELAFTCPEPAHASCIVLGTVEIENERVVRVCNCPRTYVWSFGSFWQVLMAKLFGSLACKATDKTGLHGGRGAASNQQGTAGYDAATKDRDCGCNDNIGRQPCCQEFTPEDGPEAYIKTLQDGGQVASDVATALLDAIRGIRSSVQYAYAPTRTDAMLLRAKLGQPAAEVLADFRKQGVQFVEREMPTNPVPLSVLDVLDASAHATFSDRLVAETRAGYVVDIRKQPVLDRVATTEGDVVKVKTAVVDVGKQLESLQKELSELKAQFANLHPPVSPPGDIGASAPPNRTTPKPRKNGRRGGRR